MSRKITPEEINKLFLFCHRHFVYHYDLQTELVDHLASSIEEQWETNAELTFNEALMASFRKFGVTGFSKIKEQKRKELDRKYNRLQWKYLLEFYRWPKMLMTLAFTLGLFTLLKISENILWVIFPYFSVLTIGIIYYFFKIYPKEFKIKTIPGKSFMLLNKLRDVQTFSITAVQIPLQIGNFWNISKANWFSNDWCIFLLAFFIIGFTIALYGNFFVMPGKVKEHFMEQYAEFVVN